MPLPTRQMVSRRPPPRGFPAARAVLEHDQARRVRAAPADREDPAHLAPFQLGRRRRRGTRRPTSCATRCASRRERRGRQRVRGLVRELARQVLRLRQDHAGAQPRRGRLAARLALEAERERRHAAGRVAVVAQVGVEAVAGEHRALGERLERRPAGRSLRSAGTANATRAALRARRLSDRAAGRAAQGLGVELRLLAESEQQHAARCGRCRGDRRAASRRPCRVKSPLAITAASGPPSRAIERGGAARAGAAAAWRASPAARPADRRRPPPGSGRLR